MRPSAGAISYRSEAPGIGAYLFQMNSGAKLRPKMAKKAIQNRLQLNEITERTLSRPKTLRMGKAIPSTIQCTLPHDLPLTKQPIPTQATEAVQRSPSKLADSKDAWYA
jgi:hypothetical protein